jgi:glycosyltransferase involved in cell wall biosynthesis
MVRHPYNIGNGAAVKTGIRQSRGKYILLMDADGQHLPSDIPRFLELADRYDMVVGARSNPANSAVHRNIANRLYNRFAAYVCNHPIEDLTSGYRLVRAEVAKSFVYLLPNTFSYPSTLTLAVIRAGYSLTYIPIEVNRRIGRSKINLVVDGTRFFMIILRIGVFFAPLRVFIPLSGTLFMTGLLWYIYKQFVMDKGFPPVSSLLMITAAIIFCIGLISEQISYLRYERK